MNINGADFIVEGKPLTLGKRIGKGGEGVVYALSDGSNRAFKFYTAPNASQREAKIRAMINARVSEKSNLVAFPLAVASHKNGQFAGFVMKLVSDHKPLFELYSPGARKQHFPQADYRFLVRTATNVARAVASVHATGCVIGDINHSGILVSDKAIAALIDADSFQLIDGDKKYLCIVGVPEYTPPELQGKNLANVIRTSNHDAFGLAVIIFQLLFMGRHPFVGSYKNGDMPYERAISEYRFAYSQKRSVGMTPPPGAATLSDFTISIADAFEQAFSEQSSASRPSAAQWVTILECLEHELTTCSRNKLHYYSKTSNQCPWCRMERQLGLVLFTPQDVRIFNLENMSQCWAAIKAVKIPPPEALEPVFPFSEFEPSIEASKAKRDAVFIKMKGAFYFLFGVSMIFIFPAIWLVWIGFALNGIAKMIQAPDRTDFLNRYIDCQERWSHAHNAWRSKCGILDLEQLRDSLHRAKKSYDALPAERQQRIADYQRHRRTYQLNSFLEGYAIRDSRIKGIGPSRQTTLASFGIETAADISSSRVQAVPGFGPSNSKPLVEWRMSLERKFVYDPSPNLVDKQEMNSIDSYISSKSTELKRILVSGAKDLQYAVDRAIAMVNLKDTALEQVTAELRQLEANLTLLKIQIPPVSIIPFTPTVKSAMSELAVPTYYGPVSAHRGNDYQRQGRVIYAVVDKSAGVVRGRVQGLTSREPYDVKIRLDANLARILSSGCSCPVGSACMHGAAVIYELIRTGKLS